MSAFFIALGNLFKKPATVKYPFEPTYKPADYRGMIVHNPDLCIWCRRCEMVCPPGAIVFSQSIYGQQTFHYNSHVCIYCGRCVFNCPKTGALVQSATPAGPAVKKDNVNNGWAVTVKESLDSRKAYVAAVKKAAEEKNEIKKAAADKKDIKDDE